MDKLGTVPLRDLDAPEDGISDASLGYGPFASAGNSELGVSNRNSAGATSEQRPVACREQKRKPPPG